MTYAEYYNQWELSVESRDLAFDEWLCLMLDRQKAIDDEQLPLIKETYYNAGYETAKNMMIEKAWEVAFDMFINPMKYLTKEAFIKAMEI